MKIKHWLCGAVMALLVLSLVGCGSRRADAAPAIVEVPTAAPTVAIPTPGLAYKQVAVNHLRNLAEGMQMLGIAMQSPRIGESDFALQVTMATSQMQEAHTRLSAVTPPVELAALHTQLTDATRACSAAADAVYLAIDKLDSNMLLASGDLLGECNVLLLPAIAALNES